MKKSIIIALVTLAFNVQAKDAKPPVGQPLIREGDLAVRLVAKFNLGNTVDEAEAENLIGNLAIAPRNGWIADYPVTPDIVGELRQSIADAADANRLKVKKDDAIKMFQETITSFDLPVSGNTPGQTSSKGPNNDNAPSTTVINNYYNTDGPPIVTYYAPPPDYVYLYTWVPHPFWWNSFWYPGFYILGDFHRPIIIHHRIVVVSNHFVYPYAGNRIIRVDPMGRFRGRTYGGVGVPRASRPYMYRGGPVRGYHEKVPVGVKQRRK
jgi:hypothetical protein